MKFQFNDDQKRVIDAGVRHLLSSSGDPVLEYSGKAGTGKSVVMHEIWKQSGLSDEVIAPMAYIGQAAIVMRLKGFPGAKTIHSWLYAPAMTIKRDENGVALFDHYLGIQEAKMDFVPKPLSGIKAIFVDEGGTVPMRMRQNLIDTGARILVAGDFNQLPPVKDSPAFLYDPGRILFLNQIMRQKEGSGILFIAERVLNNLPIANGFYGDAIVIYEDELTDDLLRSADTVLCATNNTKEYYTKVIRNQILGIDSKTPVYGDKVICRKNDWGIEVNGIGLGNGIIGTVASMPDVTSFTESEREGFKGCFKMDFKPDLFDGVFFDLDVNYEYFQVSPASKNKLKSSPFTIGHLFDYAYANTVHLTQGAQFSKVIYIEENFFDIETRRRLNYTACTRAVDQLIYVKRRPRQYY